MWQRKTCFFHLALTLTLALVPFESLQSKSKSKSKSAKAASMRPIRSCCDYLIELSKDAITLWNHFWFTPADPINLGVIRIITGLILLDTHLGTLPNLLDFIGPNAWLDSQGLNE